MGAHSLANQIPAAGETLAAFDPQFNLDPGWFLLAGRPRESCDESELSSARVLPDPAICRARDAGLADYADCLVECPMQCRHALGFAWGFFCRHPERAEIVMRTATHSQ